MKKNRAALIDYFAPGRLPTSQHFRELIESNLNLLEDGFDKSPHHGMHVHAHAPHETLLSYYRSIGAAQPEWTTAFHGKANQLVFSHVEKKAEAEAEATGTAVPLVTLDPLARVGINTADPATALDVAGTVSASGRRGQPAMRGVMIPADGGWHDITEESPGCQAWEVTAGVGYHFEGHYALLHAVALNTHNPVWWSNLLGLKKGIRHQHAYYSRRADRLQLRWEGGHGRDAPYRLCIRTAGDYRDDIRKKGTKLDPDKEVRIQVFVTKLWHDPGMDACQPLQKGAT